jgi:hypothetical protein
VKFQSPETLEKAIKYVGATDEQMAAHRKTMQQTGREAVALNFCRIGTTCYGSTTTSSQMSYRR